MPGGIHENARVVIGDVQHIERPVPMGGGGNNHGYVGGGHISFRRDANVLVQRRLHGALFANRTLLS